AGDSVSVFTNDSVGNSWSQTDQVTTDSNGDFTDKVTLPLMFIADYTVTASDGNGLTATTSFTDGNVQTATIDVRNAPAPCTVLNATFNTNATVCANSVIGNVTGSGAGNLFVQFVNPSNTVVSTISHSGISGDSFD